MGWIRHIALVGVALVALSGCTAAQRTSDAHVTVPFARAYGLVFVELSFPDGPSLLALLDTGASASAIDPRRASDLPVAEVSEVVGTTGTFQAEMVVVEGLRLGSLDLPALRATRRSLTGLLSPDDRPVEMILGSDALSGLVLTLDYGAGLVEVSAEAPAPAAESVPMVLDNGIPTIPATIGGIEVTLRIDTGASLFETSDVYVNIPMQTWGALRARHPDLAPSTHFKGIGAAGEAVDLPVARISGARIGPMMLGHVFVIVQPEAGYFADPQAKGFVSNNFLEKLGRVTLDYGAGRLQPSGSIEP